MASQCRRAPTYALLRLLAGKLADPTGHAFISVRKSAKKHPAETAARNIVPVNISPAIGTTEMRTGTSARKLRKHHKPRLVRQGVDVDVLKTSPPTEVEIASRRQGKVRFFMFAGVLRPYGELIGAMAIGAMRDGSLLQTAHAYILRIRTPSALRRMIALRGAAHGVRRLTNEAGALRETSYVARTSKRIRRENVKQDTHVYTLAIKA